MLNQQIVEYLVRLLGKLNSDFTFIDLCDAYQCHCDYDAYE